MRKEASITRDLQDLLKQPDTSGLVLSCRHTFTMMEPTQIITNMSFGNIDLPIIGQEIATAQQIYRMVVVFIGMLLNGFVLLVVCCSRQLRFPRHIYWVAISLANCLFLLECALELAVIVNHDLSACRFFVVFAGVDYSILLICISLATLDRYLAITHYEWYRKKVTNRGVVYMLIGASALTFVILTSPFWTGYQSINTCTVNMTQMHWTFAWDLLIGIICVILHVKTYITSKTVIRESMPNYSHQLPIRLTFVNSSTRQPGTGIINSDGKTSDGSRLILYSNLIYLY